jgi:hypothetical protein
MEKTTMTQRIFFSVLVFGLILAVAVSGCGKKEEPKPPVQQPVQTAPPPPPPPSVASVILAKGVNITWDAVTPTTVFKPSDRVNALVKTENAVMGNMLGVRWQYLKTNQLVKADSIALKQNGANSSSFFIERAKGLPAGEYRIDVFLNGVMGKSASFNVAM